MFGKREERLQSRHVGKGIGTEFNQGYQGSVKDPGGQRFFLSSSPDGNKWTGQRFTIIDDEIQGKGESGSRSPAAASSAKAKKAARGGETGFGGGGGGGGGGGCSQLYCDCANVRSISFDRDRSDAWAYEIERHVKSRYIPLGPPETPNKGNKIVKNPKTSAGDSQCKGEKSQDQSSEKCGNGKWKSRKVTADDGVVRESDVATHLPVLVRIKASNPEDGSVHGERTPGSKTSLSSYHKNCCSSDLRVKSKLSIGNHRSHPYAPVAGSKDFAASRSSHGDVMLTAGNKAEEAKADPASDGEEASMINSNFSEKTNMIRVESGCRYIYENECTESCEQRSYKTVILIEEPNSYLLEQEVYKVRSSTENVTQIHGMPQLFAVNPSGVVHRENGYCQKMGYFVKPSGCGLSKGYVKVARKESDCRKQIFCGNGYQLNLGESKVYLEEKKVPYQEGGGCRRCMHSEPPRVCCKDAVHYCECQNESADTDRTGSARLYRQSSSDECKHQVGDACLHSILKNPEKREMFGLYGDVPFDYLAPVYDQIPIVNGHIVPPLSRSENSVSEYPKLKGSCGCGRGLTTTYSVRPVSVIPAIRKCSKTRVSSAKWHVPQFHEKGCKHRPRSAILTSEGPAKEGTTLKCLDARYCACAEHPRVFNSASCHPRSVVVETEVSPRQKPSAVMQCEHNRESPETTPEGDSNNSNDNRKGFIVHNPLHRPLKKKKIMKICNCPHLHMEDNNIKKFCIHQCSNYRGDPRNATETKVTPEKSDFDRSKTVKTFADKETTVDFSERDAAAKTPVANSQDLLKKAAIDLRKRLLVKSTSALVVSTNKDVLTAEKRIKGNVNIRNQLIFGQGSVRTAPAKKCSIGTETKEQNEETLLDAKQTETIIRASRPKTDKQQTPQQQQQQQRKEGGEKRKDGTQSDHAQRQKNVFTKTDKERDIVFFPFEVQKDETCHSGDPTKEKEVVLVKKPMLLTVLEDGQKGKQESKRLAEGSEILQQAGRRENEQKTSATACGEKPDKTNSLNLVKLYEDLVEFQKVFSNGGGGGVVGGGQVAGTKLLQKRQDKLSPTRNPPQRKSSNEPERDTPPPNRPYSVDAERGGDEQMLRKKLRFRLAHHLQELLILADEKVSYM